MIDDVYEFFRSQLSLVYIFVLLPVTLSAFVPQKTSVVQEFKAFRIQHFDLAGNQRGSRSWKVSFDATALDSNLLRRCLIVSWKSLISAQISLSELLPATLGAVVIVIPSRLEDLSAEEEQEFLAMEEKLLERPFPFPVYLTPETAEMTIVLMNVEQQKKKKHESAVSALLSMITANSYHFVNGIQDNSVTLSAPVHNIIAKLSSFDRSEKVPSILLVAHYDSFGLAPALSFGADSNGSGLVALLELLRILSRIYENGHTRARYNLLFLLTGAGKLNYMGTKQYIEEYLEQTETSNSPSSKLEFAVCLDSLLSEVEETDLFMHVSKVPSANSSVDKFYQKLNAASNRLGLNTTIVSKKINLADEFLAWEHERFSIRKLYGFTLSHLQNNKHQKRRSILDMNPHSANRIKGLTRNIAVISDALISHIFQLNSEGSVEKLFGDLKTDEKFVGSWFDRLTSRSRAQQNFSASASSTSASMMNGGASAAQLKDTMLGDLFALVNHYSNEAHLTTVKLDKRDPEFVLYGATVDKLYAYRVKPAVFDLILALFISGYLGLIYLMVLNASVLQYNLRTCFDLIKKRV